MLYLIHPAFVHFSVAFLILGSLVEAVGLLSEREPLSRFGGLLVILGALSLVPTVITGYLAANTAPSADTARAWLDVHERSGWIVVGWFVATQFWKAWHRGHLPRGQRKLYAVLLIAGALLTAYAALLGGRLVYGHGVGVA
jgi:uncharacterized membrane protein